MSTFVHESAYVDDGAVLGEGTRVWHFCHVMPGAVIGEGCSLGQNVVVMPGTRIGNNVKIQNNVSIYEGVELEDDVFCGPSMVFTNVINPRSHITRKHEYRRTLVRQGASIGANATIVCGVELGRYAFVGAGAVVSKDVPAYALVVGVPARQVGWVCQCGERLPESGAGRGQVAEDRGQTADGRGQVAHGRGMPDAGRAASQRPQLERQRPEVDSGPGVVTSQETATLVCGACASSYLLTAGALTPMGER